MNKQENKQFKSTFQRKLIYIFRVNDNAHKGYLKIGDATIDSQKGEDVLVPNCHELNKAAKDRIDSYTSEAGIIYELLHTELAVYKDNKTNKVKAFRDHNVHSVLKRSGIKVHRFETRTKQNEWFVTDLETAKKAIQCVKEGKTALDGSQITSDSDPIVFRPEQKWAIEKTVKRFKTHKKMLWNAKMRFGKTLTALQVVKDMDFDRTIIITHRPVVDSGWFEDFNKIFYNTSEFQYGSKNKNGHTFKDLINSGKKFVYFASIQDLRGSEQVGGVFDKNNEIFSIDWDFLIIDEAHEGTKTELGKAVINAIIKSKDDPKTYQLLLSGTPYNLLTDFDINDIVTWDYVMEQDAKEKWNLHHYGDSNPYDGLPQMNIFTYDIKERYKFFDIEDKAFNFREFFRTYTGDIQKDKEHIPQGKNVGDFVHEKDIKAFLKLLCKKDEITNYPFSTDEYRNNFRHSLWMVPGVKEAKALSKLLKADDSPFLMFDIVNVAGNGDEEVKKEEALQKVRKAITNNPENTYTITLSCGKLTTGVSIPEWTAVLMLSGSYSTEATQYMQTIFRVQTPANIDGKMKEDAYVFDFAPDRTLKMIADAVQRTASTYDHSSDRAHLDRFLNFCPVISINGSSMTKFSVNHLLQELKKAYVERVYKSGFEDSKIYNDELLKLDDLAIKEFDDLKQIIGQTHQTKKIKELDVNKQGFTEEEWERIKEEGRKKDIPPELQKRIEEEKEKKKQKDIAISILRGISIRMPLMVYGIDKNIDIDITVDNFADEDLIDDQSWNEFMPKGVDRKTFKKFAKYYDKDIFVAASRRIRNISKSADELEPLERIKRIADLFSTFKNPDKETVLTPWRVVNMHMSDCIGGYCFYDGEYVAQLDKPRFVKRGDITKNVLQNPDSVVLEINSKTGLYPLYIAYSIYEEKCKKIRENELNDEKKREIWDDVINNNIFVVCKTPMAKSITRRTLVGYRNKKTNLKYFENLINQLKEPSQQIDFIKKITKGKTYWKAEGKGDNMKFNAIVGNPPYQEVLTDNKMSRNIYHEFAKSCIKIEPDYFSLIMPSKWMGGELGPYKEMKGFYEMFTNGDHIELMHDYSKATDVFTNVDIKGGICYFLYSKDYSGKLNYYLHENDNIWQDQRIISNSQNNTMIRYPQLIKTIELVNKVEKITFDSIVSSWNPYGFISDLFVKDYKITLSDKETKNNNILIYGLIKNKRAVKYIAEKDMIKKSAGFNKYKTFITRANGSGVFGERFSLPIVAKPLEICTDTFLEVGPFNTKFEAEACAKYVKTKFFRALVGAKKTGVFSYKDAFQYVPIQDFSKTSKIDWTRNINEIDKQLYKRYKLDDTIISFIEEKVLDMD